MLSATTAHIFCKYCAFSLSLSLWLLCIFSVTAVCIFHNDVHVFSECFAFFMPWLCFSVCFIWLARWQQPACVVGKQYVSVLFGVIQLLQLSGEQQPVLVCLICWQHWATCGLHENLRLPDRNEFIPVNFNLAPREAEVGVGCNAAIRLLEVFFFFNPLVTCWISCVGKSCDCWTHVGSIGPTL